MVVRQELLALAEMPLSEHSGRVSRSASAIVVSFAGRPPLASDVSTPVWMPTRAGKRPVIIDARLGLQRWKALYQCMKVMPSVASFAKCGKPVRRRDWTHVEVSLLEFYLI